VELLKATSQIEGDKERAGESDIPGSQRFQHLAANPITCTLQPGWGEIFAAVLRI
jgi:hypothetical protein